MQGYIDWHLRGATTIVEKGWGREIIFTDNNLYTGKLLEFKADKNISLHFHVKKHETWYVAKGRLKMFSVDPRTAEEADTELKVGDVVELPPGAIHRLYSYEDSTIFEVSTPDDPKDSYRIEPGDSQKEDK